MTIFRHNTGNAPQEVNVARKYSSLFDAYAKKMHRFVTEISINNPEQATLLGEFNDYPELRPFLKSENDPNTGDFLGLVVKPGSENDYKMKREELKAKGIQIL